MSRHIETGEPGAVRPRTTPNDDHSGADAARLAGVIVVIACLLFGLGSASLRAADDQSPRRIYVPTEDLDALVNRDTGGVVLKKVEFEKLLTDAKAAGEGHIPADAVLGNAVYTAKVDGEQLVVTITVDGTNFHTGWATLPVRVGGLGIEAATVGEEAAIITRGDPPELIRWLLKEVGKATLTLTASRPLEVVGSDRVAIFDLAGAPAGELRLTLPPGKHLQVGGVALKRPAAQDAEAEYILPIGGHKSIELRITDRASESQADALTFASTAHGLYVAPGEVTWTAQTNLQVIGRKIDRLIASVPRGVEITAIESVGLESWDLADLADSPTRTTITLNWRQPYDGSRAITFRGVLGGLDGGEWTAPNLELQEVTSHTGVVEVQYPAGVRVQPRNSNGARASIANAETATSLSAGAVGRLRYDVWVQDFELAFTTSVKSRELHAAMTNLVDVTNDGLMLFTLVSVTPQFDSLFELQLGLKAEWEVQELSVNGAAVQWTSNPVAAGVNEYRIPLDPPLPPGESRSLRLVARRILENWPVEQTPVRFELPEVKLPQAGVVEALYGVTGEDDLVLTPIDVTGLDPARREDLASLERQLSEQGRTLRLGFAYQDTVFSAQIETVRKPTRISAATLSFVQLDRETVNTQLETQVRVEGGGAKELRVSLPEAAGTEVRFNLSTVYLLQQLRAQQQQAAQLDIPQRQESYDIPYRQGPASIQTDGRPFWFPPRIVEQSAAAPENGRRVWTLKLDRRLYGDAVVWTTVREARTAGAAVAPLVLEVAGAERQNGHIAVIAGSDQRVTLTATAADGQPLPLVDPVEFPESYTFPVQALRSGRQRIVASVQYLQPGYTASVADQRFDRSAVPTAVCREAVYATVVSPSGELQHEATYQLVAVGVQSLAVRLPEGDNLWAALVDGSPVEVRRAGADAARIRHVLPLPSVAQADQVRTVQLLYRGATTSLAGTGEFRQTPPELAVVTGQGGEQPLEVLQQRWVVHHSPDTLLLESDGRFHTDGPLYAGTFLGRLGSMWQLPTQREGVQMAVIAGVVLLTLVIVTFLLKRVGFLPTVLIVAAVGIAPLLFSPVFSTFSNARLTSDTSAPASVASSAPHSESGPAVYGGLVDEYSIQETLEDRAGVSDRRRGGAIGGQGGMGGFGGGGGGGYFGGTGAAGPATDQPATPLATPMEQPASMAAGVRMRANELSDGAIPPPAAAEPAAAPLAPAPDFSTLGRPSLELGGVAGGEVASGRADMDARDRFRQGSFGVDPFNQPNANWSREPAQAGAGDAAQWAAPNLGDINANGVAGYDFTLPLGQIQAGQQGGGPTGGTAADYSGVTDLFAKEGRPGALLSLALALAPPKNFVAREFRYVGSETEPAAVDLDVAYADRNGSQMLLGAIAAAVLLILWWLRKTPLATCGLLAVVTIAGPLALSSLVPPTWLVPLDGVLIGGVLGVVLWCVLALVRWCPGCCAKWRWTRDKGTGGQGDKGMGGQGDKGTAAGTVVASALLFALLSLSADTLSAEEAAPPEAGRPVVIVPYAPGTDPLAAEQVLVPREYFLRLWKAARPEEQPEGLPPASGVVAAAIYKAELEPEVGGQKPDVSGQRTVKVTARFVLRQLVEESTSLALPIGPVAIESAQLDGAPATLRTSEDGGTLEVVLSKPGLQVLDVIFRVSASNVTADSGRFTLPLRPVATGRLAFAVPGDEQTEVRLNGSTDAYRVRDVEGVRTLETNVDHGGDVTLAWRPKTAKGAGEGTIQVESTIGATLDDSGLTVRHRFRYVVSQGTLADVSFTLPAGVSLKRIAGADVSGWEQGDEGGSRTLKVFLRRDVDDSTALDIDLFQPVTLTEMAATLDVPTLQPTGITREKGDLAVFAEPQLAVQTGTVAGLRQVNVANFTMDAALTQPGATARFAYRFDGRPFTLPASLSRRQPETRVTTEHGAQVLLRKVTVASRFVFDLREAPRANLSFTLPANYLPLDVQGDYLVDWSVSDVDGSRVLTVELDEPRTGRVQMLLQGTQPRDATAANVTITVPQPIAVNRQESQLGVWIDDTFTATVGNVPDWRPQDPAELTQAIRELRQGLPQFGFRSTQTAPGAVTIDLQRAQAELSADAVVLAAASDASLDYGLTLRWRIDRAAADQFVVTTPDWMGERVEFNGEGIRQIESLPRAAGGRTWRITLHEPVAGQYLLSAVSTLPLPADDLLRVPDIRFLRPDQPPDEASELAIQRRFLVLVNLSGVHRLDAVNADLINPAQRDQLPLTLPDELLNQAVEIASLPVARPLPEWKLTSTAGTQEAAATVILADLRTVLAHDGSWRTQADYRIRNRGRQFLAIVPPADARLLSVLVRGQPSEAIRQAGTGAELLLVPLPATSIVDLSFPVRLVFAGRLPAELPEGLSVAAREITLPAPQVATKAQSAEFWLPVLHTLWRVDVPEDMRAQLVDGNGRSNVIPGDDTAAEEAYGKTVIDDLKSQLSIQSYRENARKSLVQDHLHNLAIAVQNYSELAGAKKSPISQEEAEVVEKATKQLQELQAQVERGEEPTSDASLERNDFGRKFIVGNNADILNSNGGSGIAMDGQDWSKLNLNFADNEWIQSEVAEAKPEAKAERQTKSAQTRAAVKGQLGDQQLSYSNSFRMLAVPQQQQQSQSGIHVEGIPALTPGTMNFNTLTPDVGLQMEVEQRQLLQPDDVFQSLAIPALGAVEGENAPLFNRDAPASAGREWTASGGLSLDMALPTTGRELTFTKVGGEPQLTLAFRSEETIHRGLGLVWGLACLLAALGFVRWLTRGGFSADRAAWGLVVIGLVAAWLLPTPVRYVGLAAFIAAAGWLIVRRVAAVHTR